MKSYRQEILIYVDGQSYTISEYINIAVVKEVEKQLPIAIKQDSIQRIREANTGLV